MSIAELLDAQSSESWLLQQFHPTGFKCAHCGADVSQARIFRRGQRTRLADYRCKRCSRVYNLYSGTIFAHKQMRPQQVVLLLRGIQKGESAATIANEVGVSWRTVHNLRRKLRTNGSYHVPMNGREKKNGHSCGDGGC